MDAAESYLTQKMLERFGNDEDAFTIVNQSAVMETMESVTNTLAWKAARKHPIDALRYSG